jgi:hypothetical protein
LFSRTLDSSGKYYIPNPYFAGDRDGVLTVGEWGTLTKSSPISLSLLSDEDPSDADPSTRFNYLSDSVPKKIIFDAGSAFVDGYNSTDDDEALFTWTLSALDIGGTEFTLQGLVWESDFVDDCTADGGSVNCFVFDLNDTAAYGPSNPDGDAYAGEDINGNLSSTSFVGGFNRVSGVSETFLYETPYSFIEDLNSAMTVASPDWESAKLTINLIATLAETSGVTSNSLKFKLESDEPWADEYTYIVSEGFAVNIKQTIQTRFRRESAISIFSYVIFQ